MGAPARFIALSWHDRGLVVAAACAIATAWVGLRTVGFDAVGRAAARRHAPARRPYEWCLTLSRPRSLRPVRAMPERIAWAIRAVGDRIPGGRNCLVRALATQALLSRHGYDAQLRIGVRKAGDGSIAAHAWLEAAGIVLVGDFELGNYTTLNPAARGASGLNAPQA
jgi:hypothetical protein